MKKKRLVSFSWGCTKQTCPKFKGESIIPNVKTWLRFWILPQLVCKLLLQEFKNLYVYLIFRISMSFQESIKVLSCTLLNKYDVNEAVAQVSIFREATGCYITPFWRVSQKCSINKRPANLFPFFFFLARKMTTSWRGLSQFF